MKKTIAWGITGSGVYIRETIELIERLSRAGYKITAFVSRAGETILRMYGLKNKLEEILVGEYPIGVVYEDQQPPGYPVTGRLYLGVYDVVVISPASMNTIAKIVHGIADSLVSNLAMHAIKSRVPLVVLPVDAIEAKSTIPLVIDRGKCKKCTECLAANVCVHGALVKDQLHRVRVYPERCTRCYICLDECPFGAIKFDVEISVRPVRFYVDVIDKLRMIEGITVTLSPRDILEALGVDL